MKKTVMIERGDLVSFGGKGRTDGKKCYAFAMENETARKDSIKCVNFSTMKVERLSAKMLKNDGARLVKHISDAIIDSKAIVCGSIVKD